MAVVGCIPSTPLDSIVLGEQVTAEDPTTVTTPVGDSSGAALPPPTPSLTIADMAVTGDLTQGQSNTILVSCAVASPSGLVQAVSVDLSPVGGPSAQLLAASGNLWTWNGTVTPPVAGSRTITFTAIDDRSAVTTNATGAVVAANEASPLGVEDQSIIVDRTVRGQIIQGQACNIIVSCRAGEQAGPLAAVSVDLSPLGGSASQALTYDGYFWTWSGAVTPPAGGVQAVTFAATDEGGLTTTALASVGVADPRVTVAVPGVTMADGTATWIEANRVVQGEPCAISISCDGSTAGSSVQSVVADLSPIGGAAQQPLTRSGNRWTWSGTVTPPTCGIQQVALISTGNQGATAAVSTVVGVMDPQVLRGDWLFVIGSVVPTGQTFEDYVERLVRGVEATGIPVVLLECGLWDWNDSPRAYSSFSKAQITYLVRKLRELPGVTVGFHSCPTGNYNTGNRLADLATLKAWLHGEGNSEHPGALSKLTSLGAKIAYADGSPWSSILFYEQSLRNAIGHDGILLEGDISRDGLLSEGNAHFACIDGSTTRDQGDLSDTYFFAHPRAYVDWRISIVSDYQTFLPAWTRFEIGWIGECIEWWIRPVPKVALWPLSDYEYAWARSRESGIPLQYRTTVESLSRLSGSQPDPRLQRLGQMQQNEPTTTTVARNWSGVAISADGTKMVAIAYGGYLFVSTDSGATWTQRGPAGNARTWSCVAMSASGARIVVGAWDGSLYVSTDTGVTWTERRPAGDVDLYWQQVAMSADGTKIVARLSTYRHSLYASTDAGNTWKEIQLPGTGLMRDHESWSSAAMSSDGSILLATDSFKLHTATQFGEAGQAWGTYDFGVNWPSWDDGLAIIAGYPRNTNKSCIAMSSSGKTMISGSWPDRLYLSQDSGKTWTEAKPQPAANSARQFWQCVAMSSDGTKVIVGARPGRLYTGTYSDQAWTWTEVQPAGNMDKHWEYVAMSSDSTRIIATDGDAVYTSANSGATWTLRQPGDSYYGF